MTSEAKRTIDLPVDQTSIIDELIESGRFRTEADVVRAGLLALQDQDATLDRWLRDEVVPVVVAMRAEPGRGRTADDVFDGIRSMSI